MWNITYSSNHMNEWEQYNKHRQHLERLTQTKTMIDNKKPNKPSFLKNRKKKEEMKKERQSKIDYENRVLFNKMAELKVKPSPYTARCLLPTYCPALDRNSMHHNKYMRFKTIKNDNEKLKKRFMSAKPTYLTNKILQEHNYKCNITKKHKNPNLQFTTFTGFQKNLKIRIERDLADAKDYINKNRNIYNNNFSTSYNNYSKYNQTNIYDSHVPNERQDINIENGIDNNKNDSFQFSTESQTASRNKVRKTFSSKI